MFILKLKAEAKLPVYIILMLNIMLSVYIKPTEKKNVWVLVPTKHLIKLMKKYPVKAGGDNWTSKGHIVPKEALITFDI